MNKIILDLNHIEKSSDFLLNLNNIEDIENLHLDLTNIIKECEEAISKKNFPLAKELLNVALKLSDYGDEKVNSIKNKYYFENINHKYKDIKKLKLKDAMNLLLEINMLFSILYSQSGLNSRETESIINNLNKIKEDIPIKELVHKNIENSEAHSSIKELEDLEQFSKEYKLIEIEELKLMYINKINEIIVSLKDKSLIDAINLVKKILKDKYPKDYLGSEEFLNSGIKDNYKNIENYNALLEFADKAYLVYRFNISSSVKEKINILQSNLIPTYIELPSIYKEYVVNQLIIAKKEYSIISEFFEVLNNIIETINEEEENKSIPI
ncbi:hypothetical protein LGK99_04475 [Clostridium algidicarnis]|uniref:hypothetical protein n=1 Tax=Clostridium algidicarnis TaxID=37659 RepID=UPI0016272971|nr:hypothetical protein [Clostridium algidicarnis]MBB6631503.1 hypothetical protein [Clostridium algidicarnis]MCB2286357.1 hypothetical protein [Clostridium algidicarnis]